MERAKTQKSVLLKYLITSICYPEIEWYEKKLLIHAKLFLSSWKMLSLENCNKTTVKILQSVLVFCDHFLGKRLRQREIMCKERLFCTKDNWSRYLYMQEKEVNVLKVGISSTSIFKRIIWNKRFWILQP